MPQLIVTASIDSFMNYHSPDTNYGANTTVNMGVYIAGGSKDQLNRAIGNFDVSAIPASASYLAAKMRRTITLVDPTAHSAKIFRCTRPTQWTENGVTWNKYDGVNNWTGGGGDFDQSTPSPVAYNEPTVDGDHEIFGLAAFVRDALDNRNGIVSLIMKNENEAPEVSQRSLWLARTFWKLIIDYNEPEQLGRRDIIERMSGRRPHKPHLPVHSTRPSAGRRPHQPYHPEVLGSRF